MKRMCILALSSLGLLSAVEPGAVNAQDFEWARALRGTGQNDVSIPSSVAVDGSGNSYTVGVFTGTVDFDPGPGVFLLTSDAQRSNGFILKLDSSGNFGWGKKLGGPPEGGAQGITQRGVALDSDGNVYSAGTYAGTFDFDPGPGVSNMVSVDGGSDVFLLKLTTGGEFVWAKSIGNIDIESSGGVAIDRKNNIYVTGGFSGTVDFDPGPGTAFLSSTGRDAFVVGFDSAGDFIWARRMGGAGTVQPNAIAIDRSGNVLTTGSFQGTVDFNPGAGTFNLVSNTTATMFVSKVDRTGGFVWARKIGGTGNVYANAIATDRAGNVHTAGAFRGWIDFDPGPAAYRLAGPVNSSGAFVSKLDEAGRFIWARAMRGSGSAAAEAYGLTTDPTGVYIAGIVSGVVDFDPGAARFVLYGKNGAAFVSKLNRAGRLVWAVKMGGASWDGAQSVALDASSNIYTVGWFRRTADFDPGPGVYNLTAVGNTNAYVSALSQD